MADGRILFSIPDLCPACGGPSDEEGDFLYCRNRGCPAKLAGSVKVWVRQLGLLHWGDAVIDALTNPDNPKISSVADLYRLSQHELSEFCSGLKMSEKLLQSLHGSTRVTLEVVLSGLNIPSLGISTATDIVRSGFDTPEKVISMTYEDLLKVPNVGEITARQVHDGIRDKRALLLDLASVLDIRQPDTGPLTGKVFCITGELSRPRKAVEKAIIDSGGSVKGSVSAGTSYLVTNFPDTGSSKMKSAKKHGVTVIDEATLMGMIGS
jgi:DNA ligase (NAD+)